jgi:hypothetical protein
MTDNWNGMESPMKPELVNLPWATLLTLACGYASYFIANVGVREHHKAIDVTFSTILFGFFSVFLYTFLRRDYSIDILTASASAFLFAILLGGLWSRYGRAYLEAGLRKSGVSYSDDLPSAWIAMFGLGAKATQLTVKLKDGSWLKCDDLSRYAALPNGPCVLGGKGDLLMYVTHIQGAGAEDFESCSDTVAEQWGAEITYIPAGEIVRLDLRRADD